MATHPGLNLYTFRSMGYSGSYAARDQVTLEVTLGKQGNRLRSTGPWLAMRSAAVIQRAQTKCI